MSDVAAIQAAFRDIEDSRALLLAVFVHTPLGMALYDRDGWAIADNPAHRAMFGPRPPGRYNLLQDPRVDASGQRLLIERGLAGEAVTLPPYVSTNRVDGRPLQVTQSSWFPVRGADGQLLAVALASRDITAEELLARRAETGASLIIITHDTALAERAERIITLADGRIASDRTAGAEA